MNFGVRYCGICMEMRENPCGVVDGGKFKSWLECRHYRKKQTLKCFPETAQEYWALLDARDRGDIIVTQAGKKELAWKVNGWSDLDLYRGMPDYKEPEEFEAVAFGG